MITQLPMIGPYTIDWRLREFRRVFRDKSGQIDHSRPIEFVPFDSTKGRRLLKQVTA